MKHITPTLRIIEKREAGGVEGSLMLSSPDADDEDAEPCSTLSETATALHLEEETRIDAARVRVVRVRPQPRRRAVAIR